MTKRARPRPMCMDRRGLLLAFGWFAMRAAFAVNTRGSKPQPFNRPSRDEVLGHNLLHVARMNVAVPDSLRVDHDHGTVFALVQTARFIGAHLMLKASVFDGIFEGGLQLLASLR